MSKSKALKEKERDGTALTFAENKAFFISGFAIFCLWVVFSWQGLRTVVEIWYGNEIFNHGFFIVPGAFYLIYLKRKTLLAQPIQTSPLAFIVIIPALLLYIIGVAGDIQLFLHAATFTLLPALIWLLIGTKAAKTILFPLVFMLFSIPIGEQLIPYLQEIAADGSVSLLQLTGVPLYRSGLFIEIPQGRFLVAEACSGVSFFIASFVIGSLYAYLNLVSTKRRIAFVAISLIFPVLANIVRVYGIILIAYWTDMEHAAGADHLIYGWFFFAFVIVCLLGIGELMRETVQSERQAYSAPKKPSISFTIFTVLFALFIVSTAWAMNITSANNAAKLPSKPLLNNLKVENCSTTSWQPIIVNADVEETIYLSDTNCGVKVYAAWFSEQDNELVSDLHRIFDPEQYSLSHTTNMNKNGSTFSVYHVVSSNGEKLSIVRWYNVDDKLFTSSVKTKVHQLKNVLLGNASSGRMYVLAAEGHDAGELESAITVIVNGL
ncbi:exosortase A [Alteromonas sp. MB-3u-76]|uniref:exosortase A n=1 Tax=Alteromonas sp. MB-3u-76 TaxID=2058133 RepID=UPI000C3111C4|nr:exosortase A [Alteromonas sp. MB-3u-76]AUC89125.1 exosortase A [Alteromonas sp. MB-3u-76]